MVKLCTFMGFLYILLKVSKTLNPALIFQIALICLIKNIRVGIVYQYKNFETKIYIVSTLTSFDILDNII